MAARIDVSLTFALFLWATAPALADAGWSHDFVNGFGNAPANYEVSR